MSGKVRSDKLASKQVRIQLISSNLFVIAAKTAYNQLQKADIDWVVSSIIAEVKSLLYKISTPTTAFAE